MIPQGMVLRIAEGSQIVAATDRCRPPPLLQPPVGLLAKEVAFTTQWALVVSWQWLSSAGFSQGSTQLTLLTQHLTQRGFQETDRYQQNKNNMDK